MLELMKLFKWNRDQPMITKLKEIMKSNKISNIIFKGVKDVYYYFYELKNKRNLNHIKSELNNIHVKSIYETALTLINSNKSMGRFGDGDLSLILTKSNLNDAEKHSKSLRNALDKVLHNNSNDFMVALPDAFKSLDNYTVNSKRYWIKFLNNYGNQILPNINRNRIYYDTSVTRPYMDFQNKKESGLIFYLMKHLWLNRNVLIVEGTQSRVGVKDDLFNGVRTIKRIECPATNAFESYGTILGNVLAFLNKHKNYITILSLGSTATVLSLDLCNRGFRAIDIGNLDLEYEWYLRGYSHKTDLPYKYVLEVPNGNHALPIPSNSKYYKEIICKI